MTRPSGFEALSLVRSGAPARLVGALAASALVWGTILWAIA